MRTISRGAMLLGMLLSGLNYAQADDNGFITIHDLRREGRYLCTVSHEHSGTGTSQRTKRLAIRSAARDWSSFTAWEYGTDWGRWSLARGKKISCQGARGNVTCTVVARPCKRWRRARRRR